MALKKNKCGILNYLYILLGVFVTMPIITVKIAGNHISIFSILFALFFGVMCQKTLMSKNIYILRLGKMSGMYAIWFYIAFCSSLFGLLYFSGKPEWSDAVMAYIPKIILYLLLLLMLAKSDDKETIISAIFKGFLIGCVFNIAWSVIEGFVYYIFNFSLNNRLFADYITTLPADRQFITIIKAEGIRTPGFNYDPAHLGGIIPIVVLYSLINKKYMLLLLSLVSLAFSQSTTALVVCILIILLNMSKLKIAIVSKKFLRELFTILSCFALVVGIAAVFKDTQLVMSVQTNTVGFINRVSSLYIANPEANVRTLYYLYAPLAMVFNGIKTITGMGFGTASYPYLYSPEISGAIGRTTISAYDPESTYISYLFNVGIIGFVIYIVILYRTYKYYDKNYNDKNNTIILASLGSIIFSGFFYHYILTAYQVIILIMASVLMDKRNKIIKRRAL